MAISWRDERSIENQFKGIFISNKDFFKDVNIKNKCLTEYEVFRLNSLSITRIDECKLKGNNFLISIDASRFANSCQVFQIYTWAKTKIGLIKYLETLFTQIQY